MLSQNVLIYTRQVKRLKTIQTFCEATFFFVHEVLEKKRENFIIVFEARRLQNVFDIRTSILNEAELFVLFERATLFFDGEK